MLTRSVGSAGSSLECGGWFSRLVSLFRFGVRIAGYMNCLALPPSRAGALTPDCLVITAVRRDGVWREIEAQPADDETQRSGVGVPGGPSRWSRPSHSAP